MILKTVELDKDRDLYSIFEADGKWFLPQNSDQAVAGKIQYSKGDIFLTIIDTIKNQPTQRSSDLLSTRPNRIISIIHGVTNIGKNITLHECYQTKSQAYSNGIVSIKYRILAMFVGELLKNPFEAKFSSLEAAYSNFNKWYLRSGLSLKESYPKQADIITSSLVELISVDLLDDLKMRIAVDSRIHNSLIDQNILIKEIPRVTIGCSRPRRLQELMDAQNCFRYFLMLAMMNSVYPERYVGYIDDKKIEIYPAIRIYNKSNIVSWDKMLFVFPKISEDFSRIIKMWWLVFKKYEGSIITYFSAILNEYLATNELTFQTIVQSLESYHRKKFPDPHMPPEQYEQMIQNLLEKAQGCRDQIQFIGSVKSW